MHAHETKESSFRQQERARVLQVLIKTTVGSVDAIGQSYSAPNSTGPPKKPTLWKFKRKALVLIRLQTTKARLLWCKRDLWLADQLGDPGRVRCTVKRERLYSCWLSPLSHSGRFSIFFLLIASLSLILFPVYEKVDTAGFVPKSGFGKFIRTLILALAFMLSAHLH